MKKHTTAATNGIEKLQRLTLGLDLGDRSSHYCILDEMGRSAPWLRMAVIHLERNGALFGVHGVTTLKST